MRQTLRRWIRFLRATPLHPQWLLDDRKWVTSCLGAIRVGRVLDIGCSDRWVQRRLEDGCEYVGLDYPATGLQMYGARPDLFANAASLPLRRASMDAVVMLEVLEHLRDPRNALQETARVLRPGGQLLLSVPFLYPIHDAPYDYQRFTVHGLIREIEAVGLRVDHVRPSLGSAETAGLVACLAIGGMALEAMRQRHLNVLLLPILAMAIPLINALAWLGGRLLPSWGAVTSGYQLMAIKP